MRTVSLCTLLGFLSLALASEKRAPQCREYITIPVSITVENIILPSSTSDSALGLIEEADAFKLTSTLRKTTITGQYVIAGRYCEPKTSVPSRKNTLQLLVHGITFDRNYWLGLGPPGNQFNGTAYSWIDYASNQGFPTLSIDRLCNGNSSTPNGLLVCQVPANVEAIHGVVQAARAGQIASRAFNKVIFIGHSEGSIIGNFHAQRYPQDFEAYVQTGFSPFLNIAVPGSAGAAAPLPAAVVNPTRFGTLDPAYVLPTNERGEEGIFYVGQYSHDLEHFHFVTQGPLTIGEIATASLGQLPALQYTNPILVLNGQRDQIFCARLLTDPLLGFRGDCGSGDTSYTALTKALYPNAPVFKYAQVSDTGHNLNLHYTGQQVFKIAHDFLNKQGF